MSLMATLGNIGPAQRRRRRSFGVVALVAATLLAVGGSLAGAPALARLLLAPLLLGGFLGVLQAREHT